MINWLLVKGRYMNNSATLANLLHSIIKFEQIEQFVTKQQYKKRKIFMFYFYVEYLR